MVSVRNKHSQFSKNLFSEVNKFIFVCKITNENVFMGTRLALYLRALEKK